MLIKDNDAVARLHSPNNLMNQIKNNKFDTRAKGMSLFGLGENRATAGNKANEASSFVNPFVSTGDDPTSPSDSSPSSPDTDSDRSPSTDLVLDEKSALDLGKSLQVIQVEPSIDDLLGDTDSQIHITAAHKAALDVVNATLTRIALDINTVNPAKLPAILTAAQKTVDSIRKEKLEMARTGNRGSTVHHFYTPTQRKIETFEVIEVGEAKERAG